MRLIADWASLLYEGGTIFAVFSLGSENIFSKQVLVRQVANFAVSNANSTGALLPFIQS